MDLPSYHALSPRVRRDQIGAEHLHELYQRVAELTHGSPVVLDAADLISDLWGVVSAYCACVGTSPPATRAHLGGRGTQRVATDDALAHRRQRVHRR